MTDIQIQCFLEAVKTKSFTHAAKNLYLSSQVVSQHIAKLEQEIKAPLFERNKEGVILTQMGWNFLEFSTKWVGLYEQTLIDIQDTYKRMSQSLKLGVSEYIDITGRLSSGILDFKEKNPSISVEGQQYSNRYIMQKLQDGEIDIAIMCDTQVVSGGDFVMRNFAQEDLRLYISGVPEHKKDHPLTPEELEEITQNLPHIDASYGIWNSKDWDEMSRRMSSFLGFTVRERHVMPNFQSVIACIKTMPCTIVCDARFGYLRDKDNIYSIPLSKDTSLCCVWLKNNENPLIQDFVDYMSWYYNED